ncbi:unnamed protein product, partial [Gulo gulo]
LGREGSSSTRPENSPNKAHHADLAGRSERREKIHPNSSPLPEARNRWSRAQREKEDGFSMGESELQRQGSRNEDPGREERPGVREAY